MHTADARPQEPLTAPPELPGFRFLPPARGAFALPGRQHHQLTLEDLNPGVFVANLVREPHNAYDANAIQIHIGDWHVGYLPRKSAEVLAPQMDRTGQTYKAAVEVTAPTKKKKLWAMHYLGTYFEDTTKQL